MASSKDHFWAISHPYTGWFETKNDLEVKKCWGFIYICVLVTSALLSDLSNQLIYSHSQEKPSVDIFLPL